ncbi:MAG: abortive infection family protein [Nanoarchaeota archaeon]
MSKNKHAPLTDLIIYAVARLVNDAQVKTREPSHSDIEFQIKRVGLIDADPNKKGKPVGKAKRVRAVLSWALENNITAGEKLVSNLLSLLRSLGGFREASSNYVGKEEIENAKNAFKTEGYNLTSDGELRPFILDNLSTKEMKEALKAYIRRAKRGVEDAALLTGTSKDLLEAVAKFVISEKWGDKPKRVNFPTLLGQAFTALEIATPQNKVKPGEPAQKRLERSLYELGCAVNTLRNKEGIGHGRIFLPNVSEDEARLAIESIGIISEFLLSKLEE